MTRATAAIRASILAGALLTSTIATAQVTVSREEAARFLAQATLGATWEEIEHVSDVGPEPWLATQFERPIGYHRPYLDSREQLGLEVSAEHRRWSWWEQVLDGPDPLRQRVALALSELLVVSDELGTIRSTPQGLADYYDMLLDNAFGNYRDLLRDVTLHPVMGTYLSHLRNARSGTGRFPDENFAREIMQLFSIGLFELNPDGTERLDGTGRPIPTYDNDDITEFARVFTGLAFDSPERDFREGRPVWTRPMVMYEEFHEPGPKHLLRGRYVPPGQTGMQDIEDAIDCLFEHPNTGPFVARRLIQRLVTSNPGPAYVERVSAAFADNGAGVRGDMQAVLRAILLDPEARDTPSVGDIHRGRLLESFLRRVQLARAFDARNLVGTYPIDDGGAPTAFGQRPLSSPTVFNFFLPDHRPTGDIADAGLVAPEFQIVTTVTAITSANSLRTQIDDRMNGGGPLEEVSLDLTDELAIASNPAALIDRLDLLLMAGSMSGPTRAIVQDAVQRIDDPVDRVRTAVFLISISPEYNVHK